MDLPRVAFCRREKIDGQRHQCFSSNEGEICLAVQANYEWLMYDDTVIHFSGMSVFDLTPDKRKIKKMSTFYDTPLVRLQLAALRHDEL